MLPMLNKQQLLSKQCTGELNGFPVKTVSGKKGRILFIQKDTLAPLVVSFGESMENYTIDGKHLYDSTMDLTEPSVFDFAYPITPSIQGNQQTRFAKAAYINSKHQNELKNINKIK